MDIKDPKIPIRRNVTFIDTSNLIITLYEAYVNYRWYEEDTGWMYNISLFNGKNSRDVCEKCLLPSKYLKEVREQLGDITIKYNQERNKAIKKVIEDTWIKAEQEHPNKD